MENFTYYALAIIVLVVGLVILKKVTTCLIKAAVAVAMIVCIAVIYWLLT